MRAYYKSVFSAGMPFLRNSIPFVLVFFLSAVCGVAAASTYSVPADKLDAHKVCWGSAAAFDKPAEVDFKKLIEATPEYREIKKKKIERGTGKYWILMSDASDRAIKAIVEVGEETDYDLIVAKGCLSSLDPPIEAEDITERVIKKITGDD